MRQRNAHEQVPSGTASASVLDVYLGVVTKPHRSSPGTDLLLSTLGFPRRFSVCRENSETEGEEKRGETGETQAGGGGLAVTLRVCVVSAESLDVHASARYS